MKSQYKSIAVLIAAGERVGEKEVAVPVGDVIFAGATIAGNANDELVSIGLEDETGRTVQDELEHSWYNGRTGTFEQRSIELDYRGGTLLVRARSQKPVAQSVYVQMVFKVKSNHETNCES